MKPLFILLVFLSHQALAQQVITGVVLHGKEPIPGANIFIKNSYDGCTSNAEGKFSLATSEKDSQVLVVSCIGFKTVEMPLNLVVNKSQNVRIKLQEKANELNTVDVIAGSFSAGASLKKATVLSSLDIATTAGGDADIFSAIQTLPGTQPNSNEEGLFVRGGTASETKTIFDGTWVQKPFMNDMPNVAQRGRFGPFAFKGMSFSSGAYSAQYGQALSGVMILDSKDFPSNESTDIGILSVGASLGHTEVWKRTSLNMNVSYYNLALANQIVSQNIDWIKDPESLQWSSTLRQKVGTNGLIKMYSEVIANKAGFNFDNAANDWKTSTLNNKDQSSYNNLSYSDFLNEHWKVQVGMSFNLQNNKVLIDTLNLKRNDYLLHTRAMLSRSLGKISQIRFGAENVAQHKFEGLDGNNRSFTEQLQSLFVETDIYITHRLLARVGLRAENSQYLNSHSIVPRASLAYRYKKHHDFSVAYGQFAQNPNDEYMIASSALSFERSEHFLATYQWINDDYVLRLEAFRKDYTNLVLQDNASQLSNDGYGYATGVEIFWRDKKSIKRGDYWLSYSYVDTKRQFQNYPTAVQPNYISDHVLTAVYKQYFPKITTQIGATYTVASGRPYALPNESTFLSGRTKAIHNLSLNASYLTTIKSHFTVVHASIGNVAGVKNIFGYQTGSDGTQRALEPNARRSVMVGVFISIGDDNVLN
jgi:hypothetical protein